MRKENTLDIKIVSKGINVGSLNIKIVGNNIQLSITKIGKK